MALTRKKVEEFISAFISLRDQLPDDLASTAIPLYPSLNYEGKLIPSGTRINWKGEIKRATVDLWDTEENDPDHAINLWETIDYKLGYRIIPTSISVSSAFSKDEIGWWDDKLYKSLIDANVYTPLEYPMGWAQYFNN